MCSFVVLLLSLSRPWTPHDLRLCPPKHLCCPFFPLWGWPDAAPATPFPPPSLQDQGLQIKNIPAILVKVSEGDPRYVALFVCVHKRNVGRLNHTGGQVSFEDTVGPPWVYHSTSHFVSVLFGACVFAFHLCLGTFVTISGKFHPSTCCTVEVPQTKAGPGPFPLPASLMCRSHLKNDLSPNFKAHLVQDALLFVGGKFIHLSLFGLNFDTSNVAQLGQVRSVSPETGSDQ